MLHSSIMLSKIVEHFDLEIIYDSNDIEERKISVADATRPGLQLAGHYDHFGSDRIQIVGNMEYAFLSQLSSEKRYETMVELFSKSIPCLIMTRNHEAQDEILRAAKEYSVPIFRTNMATSEFYSELIKYLKLELAPTISTHGVLVEVYGEGVLLLGDSGVGKSETALELVKRGHRLVADDQVEILKVSETTLVGRAPEAIRHLIEIRGIGIVNVKELYGVSSVKVSEGIDFVINLEPWDEKKVYERVGLNEEMTELLGMNIPSITIPVAPGRNLAIIVEVAAINYRVKKMGKSAAKDLAERLFGEGGSF